MSYSNNLGSYLLSTYPNATPDVDYVIEAYAGQGPTIIHWADSLGAQPDPAVVSAWTPTSNLTDVEIMTPVFTDARRQAALFLDLLKAQVWDYLKNVSLIEPSAVTEAGVIFNLSSKNGIGVAYDDFVKNGGHPVAAQALWNRIQAVKSNYAWLTPPVEAIFAAALGQQ